METVVYKCEAKWGRLAYLKLVDDKVIFDDSDEEYGPVVFDLTLLKEALEKHHPVKPISYEEWHINRDKMAEEQNKNNI